MPEMSGQEEGVYGKAPMSQSQQQPYAQPASMEMNHGLHETHSTQGLQGPQGPHEHSEKDQSEWQTGICSCGPCSSCLLAWFLPCVLLGQTSERIRDPSMQSADMLNSDCLVHGGINCFTGCGWIYAMLKRGEIRERYGIKGSGCNDCCVSYWCPCCALIQQDNEVKTRQQAQPDRQGYMAEPAMHMSTANQPQQ
ncbi:PLAC8 family-domain-containing protein [Nemania sp. NC0429]|nr:PLAC8 family-domain-containing protein [Nemania sp. NC0429]